MSDRRAAQSGSGRGQGRQAERSCRRSLPGQHRLRRDCLTSIRRLRRPAAGSARTRSSSASPRLLHVPTSTADPEDLCRDVLKEHVVAAIVVGQTHRVVDPSRPCCQVQRRSVRGPVGLRASSVFGHWAPRRSLPRVRAAWQPLATRLNSQGVEAMAALGHDQQISTSGLPR